MSATLEVTLQEEPLLQFGGEHTAYTPKEGLLTGGPYDLRLGSAHRSQLRIGLIGPPGPVGEMRGFLKRMATGIAAEKHNTALFPDFPPFERIFRATLDTHPTADVVIPAGRLAAALSANPRDAFLSTVDLYGSAIETLAQRELPVDVAICCIPKELRTKCSTIEANIPSSQRRALQREAKLREQGQEQLFHFDTSGEPQTIEEAADPHADDLLRRNFRTELKGRAMEARLPIQLATEHLWEDRRDNEDPATRAWNLAVALFYKAGGIPWRADVRVDEACFVGISFHHLRTLSRHIVYSSLAQAFSSDGEGFALRGESVPYDEERRQPYLPREKAARLMRTVLEAYRDRSGRDPVRLVVHKTTAFTDEERAGIAEALATVPRVQLLTIRSVHDFRLLRRGAYPPHRGTVCQVNDSAFLFTVGYQAQHLTYPGPHVPVPLEIIGASPDELEHVADDVLCLTKMNWNSARSAAGLPITLAFARKVGGVMSALSPDLTPNPSFRYYM